MAHLLPWFLENLPWLRIVHGMLHLMVCNKAAILIEDKESRRCSARVDSANVGRHSIWERKEEKNTM